MDARDAGPGHLSATVHGVRNDVVAGVRDNKDGTYDVTYTPQAPGAYVVDVKWDDEHVEGSPYRVTVEDKPHPESVCMYFAFYIFNPLNANVKYSGPL